VPPPNDDPADDDEENEDGDAEKDATRGLDDDDDDDAAASTIPIALVAVSDAGGRRNGVDGVKPNGDATRAIGSTDAVFAFAFAFELELVLPTTMRRPLPLFAPLLEPEGGWAIGGGGDVEDDDDEDEAAAPLRANAKGDEDDDSDEGDGESSGEIVRINTCDGDGVVRMDSDGGIGGGL
jgi:hypothetical protein